MNVRIDEDLYRELRREAEKSGLSLSAVMRLSLAVGVELVRVTRREMERLR